MKKQRLSIKRYWRASPVLRDLIVIISLGFSFYIFSTFTGISNLIIRWSSIESQWVISDFILISVLLSVSLAFFSFRRWRELREEILKRKNMKKKMESGRSQLQAVMDGVPDIIFQVDTNLRIRWANKAALEKNPDAIGYSAHRAFSYPEGSFLDSFCKWAMDLKKIRKGITYQPFTSDMDSVSYWEGIGVPLLEKSGNVYGAIAIARDITNRMRVEHTWNLLASIIESTDDAIFGVSWNGIILSWNKGAEITYGYTPSEIVGKPISVIVPIELRKNLLAIIERVSRKENIERLVEMRIPKNNTIIYVSSTIFPFVDATGKKVGVSFIDRDITESMTAEQALRESEARFKGLFEHLSSGVAVYAPIIGGKDFILKEVNDSVEKIEKTIAEKLVNRKASDIFKSLNADNLLEALQRVWLTGNPERILVTVKKDNTVISWRDNNIYKLPSGEVVSIYDDVTESIQSEDALRKSEEKFRSLVTTAPDGIVLTDSEGTIIELNDAFANILGFNREEMLNYKLQDILPASDNNERINKIVKILNDSNSTLPREIDVVRKDGKIVPIDFAYEIIKDQHGNTINVIAIIRNITERKKFENELKISREQLRNLALHLETAREEERKRIAFEIHDELGYALTALKLDVSWLEQKMHPTQSNLIERFSAMEQLIETTIKKVRTISTKLRPSILDHFGVVAAIEWQADEFQRRTGIRCILNVNVKELKLDDTYATAVFRIFQETLTNVTRHAQASRVDVNIELTNDELSLRVSDNGRGFSMDQTTNTKSFGLLGIRERANFMGGKADINSVKNEGTTISVRVPLKIKEN